jgi:hypothetical protein
MNEQLTRWNMDDYDRQFPGSTVKRSLTAKRRRVTENGEYAAFIHCVIRAYGRRVAAGDIDAITHMAAIAVDCDIAISEAITGLRAMGYSWADIAARLGITRQAAQQRWGTGKPSADHPCRNG